MGAQPWLTYGQLGARVAALAAHLRQQGIGPGDRVALYAANVAATMLEGIAQARAAIDSGAALAKLEQLVTRTHALAAA